MSSSWKDLNNKIINRTPSPTLYQVVSNRLSRMIKTSKMLTMERISLFTSVSKKKVWKCSMTVEASLLLPLVLFFFLHLLGMVEMLRLHSKLAFALWECGNALTVYTAMPEELSEKIPDMAVSYLYVKNRVEDFLGDEYLDTSPIVKGRKGLNYLASSYDEECIDIGVSYQVAPQISIFPFPYMRLVNRYYGKSWTGYENSQDVRFVYVTIYGEVWHAKVDCSYIHITVRESDWESIKSLRNANGAKYYPCERCEEKEKGAATYYTEQGNRYHKDKECPALVRYIRAIMWEDSLPYDPCSRCVGEESVP